jgi:hypothetical protein
VSDSGVYGLQSLQPERIYATATVDHAKVVTASIGEASNNSAEPIYHNATKSLDWFCHRADIISVTLIMPNAAVISIADAVPATRAYTPISVSGNLAIHADTASAQTPAGQSTLQLKLKPATNTVSRRVNLDMAVPVEYTDSSTGNVLVKDTFRFKGEWVVPPTATSADTANFRTLVQNAVAHATVVGYVEDGDPEY